MQKIFSLIRSRTGTGRRLRRLVFYLILIGFWQGIVSLAIWPEYMVPGPWQVIRAFGQMKNQIGGAILASMKHILIGYGVSVSLGTVLGLLTGRIRIIDETIGSMVLGLQALPSICWLPLAIIWFGLNESAIIFVVVMGALFSITIGVETGVKNTPPQYIRAAQTLGARGFSLYWRVIVPAAMPSILSGLKQGWSFAWRSLMAGELLYYSLSLGNLLQTGRDLNDANMVVAVMLIIILIGFSVDRIIFTPIIEHNREKWGLSGKTA